MGCARIWGEAAERALGRGGRRSMGYHLVLLTNDSDITAWVSGRVSSSGMHTDLRTYVPTISVGREESRHNFEKTRGEEDKQGMLMRDDREDPYINPAALPPVFRLGGGV